ncbi:MAG: peptidase M14, partial [Haliscomenobacter sp.]
MKNFTLAMLLIGYGAIPLFAQGTKARMVDSLDLDAIPAGTVQRLWVHVFDNTFSQPVYVPVIVAKGGVPGPVVGLTAAIHG